MGKLFRENERRLLNEWLEKSSRDIPILFQTPVLTIDEEDGDGWSDDNDVGDVKRRKTSEKISMKNQRDGEKKKKKKNNKENDSKHEEKNNKNKKNKNKNNENNNTKNHKKKVLNYKVNYMAEMDEFISECHYLTSMSLHVPQNLKNMALQVGGAMRVEVCV